jgi:LPS O-antigen subunit length determinant protein (WzzB/FepE family)
MVMDPRIAHLEEGIAHLRRSNADGLSRLRQEIGFDTADLSRRIVTLEMQLKSARDARFYRWSLIICNAVSALLIYAWWHGLGWI